MLVKVQNKATETVVSALIKQAHKLPRELFKSLTWDRGKELADHYRFTEEDVTAARERAGSRPILVTEKDAVKLTSFAGLMTPCYVVEQQLVWDWGQNDVRSLLQHKAVT